MLSGDRQSSREYADGVAASRFLFYIYSFEYFVMTRVRCFTCFYLPDIFKVCS